MRTLKAFLMISLDGVVEWPHNWVFDRVDAELMADFPAVLDAQDTILLGRTTYQDWNGYWPTATDEPFASHINRKPKFVVSRSLEKATWGTFDAPTILRGDLAEEITALKNRPGKMIGVSGSPTLVASLLERGLLDELELTVFPVLAGKGNRFFTGDRATTRLDLVNERRFSGGVVQLTYRPLR